MTVQPDGNGLTPSKPGPGPQTTSTGGWELTTAQSTPPAGPGPPTLSAAPPRPPPPSAQQEDKLHPGSGRWRRPRTRERWACVSGAGHADTRGKGVPLTR